MTKTKRSNVLKTAKKLMAMTVARGCTEAEAVEARLKLIALMRTENLTSAEIRSGKRRKQICFYQHQIMAQVRPTNEQGSRMPPFIAVSYSRHDAAYDGAERRAKARLHPPVCTYEIHGEVPFRHPWQKTHDYSRIRALAAKASRTYQKSIDVVATSPTIGYKVPMVRFHNGVEYRWNGQHHYPQFGYAGARHE